MEESPKQNNLEPQYPKIAMEITVMCESDQDMRRRSGENDGVIESEEDNNLDRKNTEKMKEIVVEIGWPSVSKVGQEASSDAWLLVQHADHDVEFQLRCLSLMKELPAGEVSTQNIAFLTDRVRVNKGQPQVYGTQFKQINGEHVPKDIEDIDNVDKRRESMGLDTLAQNIERMYSKYPMKKTK